jgi:mRNA-degrading endonuclease RelE of RelBE toxin-antitoxin system
MKYRIEYSPDTEEHLRSLTKHQQVIVLDTVEKQLRHQPAVETRNRKPMRPNPVAPWELRIRNLRVYYDIDDAGQAVYILAIGVKKRNNVRIGKKVIKL